MLKNDNTLEHYNAEINKASGLNQTAQAGQAQSLFTWNITKDKNNNRDVEINSAIDVASISGAADTSINSNRRGILSGFGIKIKMDKKLDAMLEKYKKHFKKTKSHNKMLAQFAQFNVDMIGLVLSKLGVSQEELMELRRVLTGECIEENLAMRDENIYNMELVQIIGGKQSKVKADLEVMHEIADQLVIQAKKLDIEEEYSPQALLLAKINKCKEILESFQEEKNKLSYFLDFA